MSTNVFKEKVIRDVCKSKGMRVSFGTSVNSLFRDEMFELCKRNKDKDEEERYLRKRFENKKKEEAAEKSCSTEKSTDERTKTMTRSKNDSEESRLSSGTDKRPAARSSRKRRAKKAATPTTAEEETRRKKDKKKENGEKSSSNVFDMLVDKVVSSIKTKKQSRSRTASPVSPKPKRAPTRSPAPAPPGSQRKDRPPSPEVTAPVTVPVEPRPSGPSSDFEQLVPAEDYFGRPLDAILLSNDIKLPEGAFLVERPGPKQTSVEQMIPSRKNMVEFNKKDPVGRSTKKNGETNVYGLPNDIHMRFIVQVRQQKKAPEEVEDQQLDEERSR